MAPSTGSCHTTQYLMLVKLQNSSKLQLGMCVCVSARACEYVGVCMYTGLLCALSLLCVNACVCVRVHVYMHVCV